MQQNDPSNGNIKGTSAPTSDVPNAIWIPVVVVAVLVVIAVAVFK